MNWYACREHLELILDEMIDRFAVAPTLETIDPQPTALCRWCGEKAHYTLTWQRNEEVT